MANVIAQITAQDKALILDTRTALVVPFDAPNWIDLRIGFYLSLTKKNNDNDPTGLAEDVTYVSRADRVWIGMKDAGADVPTLSTTNFAGFTCVPDGTPKVSLATSTGNRYKLLSNANKVWSVINGSVESQNAILASDGSTPAFMFFRSAVVTGYASMFLFRVTRPDPDNTILSTFIGVSSSPFEELDIQWSDTPSIAEIRAKLRTLPFMRSVAGFDIGFVPNALYFYWPFFNSRLRLHCYVVEKFA